MAIRCANAPGTQSTTVNIIAGTLSMRSPLVQLGSCRKLEVDAALVILLHCGREVKLRQGDLARTTTGEVIKSVADNGIIHNLLLVAVFEYQHCRRLLRDRLLDLRSGSGLRFRSELGAIVLLRRSGRGQGHPRLTAAVENSRPVGRVVFHRIIHASIHHIVVGVGVWNVEPAAEKPRRAESSMMVVKARMPKEHRTTETIVQMEAVAAEAERSNARRNAVETGLSAKAK